MTQEAADRAFSLYIRLSYADFQGFVRCYTCEAILPWQEAECGHFVSRGHLATRYDEQNCRPQCRSCNEYRGGMLESFEEHLRFDLGDDAVDALVARSKTVARPDYGAIADKYRLLLKEKYAMV